MAADPDGTEYYSSKPVKAHRLTILHDVISPRFKLNMTKGLCATYRWSALVDCVIWLPSERIGSAQGQRPSRGQSSSEL